MKSFTTEGHRLAYRDEGSGEVLVIVHGTPTHSGEYAQVIERLSSRVRCIAPDHLGFGASDKPRDGDYSLAAHRRRLDALLRHLDVHRFHLLVHDFGGVIGLPLAISGTYAVKSVMILNSWVWPLVETEPHLRGQAWLVSSGLLPFLYRWFNFSPRVLVKAGWGKRVPLAADVRRGYIQQFPSRDDRSGPVSFLKALFRFDDQEWQTYRSLSALAATPVQIVWGAADKLISERSLSRWREELPGATVRVLEDVGHFVAEEAPEPLADSLTELMASSPR